MTAISSQKAYTLLEVMVAFVIVSLVLLGIITTNTSMDTANRAMGLRYTLKADTQAILNHILQNAALAMGSASPGDEGIINGFQGAGGLSGGNATTFCIHQPGTNSGGNNIIANPTDIWLCYSYVAANHTLFWCAETYAAGADPRTASACSTSGTRIGAIRTLGSVFSIQPVYTVYSATGQSEFDVAITSCIDNAAATCQAGGTSTSPESNPEIQLSGTVNPLQSSGFCTPGTAPYC